MAAVIKLKRGTSTPSTSDIASGEVAVDTSAQKLYINDSGTVKEIGGGGSGSGGITVAGDGTTYHSGTISSFTDGGGANDNTAYGKEALKELTSGDGNTALGMRALKNTQAGHSNTAIGYYAGIDIGGSAIKNTLIGHGAGDSVSGSNNTCIGYDADPSSNSVDNEITLGNSDVTKFRVPGLNFTVKDTTATEDYVLTVDANGEAGWEAAAGGTPTAITVADESSDTTCFPLFATAATGDLGPKSGSNLTFNSSTGALAATLLNGGAGDDLSLDFGSVA